MLPCKWNIFCTSTTAESRAKIGTSKMHLSHRWLSNCLFSGGGSVVVDLLLIVTPIVGFCNCSMFSCTLLYVLSGFGNHLDVEERAGCFA